MLSEESNKTKYFPNRGGCHSLSQIMHLPNCQNCLGQVLTQNHATTNSKLTTRAPNLGTSTKQSLRSIKSIYDFVPRLTSFSIFLVIRNF